MSKKKKHLSCRLLILLLIFTALIFILQHAVRITTEVQFSISSNASLMNYCNRKKSRAGNEYVLSYSVFGNNSWEKYGKNVRKVAESAAKSPFYHNWTVRVYHDLYPVSLQVNFTKTYTKLEFCDVRSLVLPFAGNLKISNINGMTWRFIPMADPTVGIMCSRDLDSELYKREEDAVHYWMHTNKTLHTMRDHPQHDIEILGGMWCYRATNDLARAAQNLELMLKNAGKRSIKSEAKKGDDQFILQRYLWPKVKNDSIQHDSYLCKSFPGSIPYPSQRLSVYEVVGGTEGNAVPECPKECRPKDHADWLYC